MKWNRLQTTKSKKYIPTSIDQLAGMQDGKWTDVLRQGELWQLDTAVCQKIYECEHVSRIVNLLNICCIFQIRNLFHWGFDITWYHISLTILRNTGITDENDN